MGKRVDLELSKFIINSVLLEYYLSSKTDISDMYFMNSSFNRESESLNKFLDLEHVSGVFIMLDKGHCADELEAIAEDNGGDPANNRVVFKFIDRLYELSYDFYSQSGADYTSIEMKEVQAKEKKVIYYE